MFLTPRPHRSTGIGAALFLTGALGLTAALAAPAPAPAFTLELLNGGTLALDSIRGSPAILLFWAPW